MSHVAREGVRTAALNQQLRNLPLADGSATRERVARVRCFAPQRNKKTGVLLLVDSH
jgi:hypothetical protein